jgi:hypothetical protein
MANAGERQMDRALIGKWNWRGTAAHGRYFDRRTLLSTTATNGGYGYGTSRVQILAMVLRG